MQVVLQIPTELVVHDGRWTTVLMGAIFSAMGGGVMWLMWTHPTGWSGNAGPSLVYLIGSVFVVVTYNYSYDGMQYQASSVTPISMSAGEDWARSIVSRYRRGSATTAYVNPDHPNNAYLLRRVSLMPVVNSV